MVLQVVLLKTLAAIGGLNKIEFLDENDFQVTPITITPEKVETLQDHLMILMHVFLV